MAKITSLRLNDRAEEMLNIIKEYYEKLGRKISDTQIFIDGLEKQFREIREIENENFKERIINCILTEPNLDSNTKDILKDMFKQIYDLLELVYYINTALLEDEFYNLMFVYHGGTMYRQEESHVYDSSEVYIGICSKVEDFIKEKLVDSNPDNIDLGDYIKKLFFMLDTITRRTIKHKE